MLIVDAHQDIAYNALVFGRDYRQSALYHRQQEEGRGTPPAIVGLPESLLGHVGIVFASLFVQPATAHRPPQEHLPVYAEPRGAYRHALRQMDYYQRLTDEDKRLRILHSRADLDAVRATWADDKSIGERQQGLLISMEGADAILEPRQLEEWVGRGLRSVGLAWRTTRYAGGSGDDIALTPLGLELLEQMAAYHLLLDVSHLSHRATEQALDKYMGQVIASHSNPRAFCDSDRHLSERNIRKLAERDGVMGIALYNGWLSRQWGVGSSKSLAPLELVVQAMDYVCQLTGSAQHVALGTDADGGFGANCIPEGLDTSMDWLKISQALTERGYSAEDVTSIMGGNWLRMLETCLL
jgi:membrane dipeptidase